MIAWSYKEIPKIRKISWAEQVVYENSLIGWSLFELCNDEGPEKAGREHNYDKIGVTLRVQTSEDIL